MVHSFSTCSSVVKLFVMDFTVVRPNMAHYSVMFEFVELFEYFAISWTKVVEDENTSEVRNRFKFEPTIDRLNRMLSV